MSVVSRLQALVLSNSARKTSTNGEIINLISVDAQKLSEAVLYLHALWAAPVQISVTMYFLWQQLGPSVLAGLGVLILLVPINIFISTKQRNYQVHYITTIFIQFAIITIQIVFELNYSIIYTYPYIREIKSNNLPTHYFQTEQIKFKDCRTKLMNEILNGIKVNLLRNRCKIESISQNFDTCDEFLY